jgi:CheY-like chemotaxis protein
MPKTVLIADGRTSRRKRLKALTDGLGYRLLEAGEAAQALAQLTESRPQVVIAGSGFADRGVAGLVREIKRRFRDVEILVPAANRSYRLLLGRQPGDPSGRICEGRAAGAQECPMGLTPATGNARESRERVRYRSGAQAPEAGSTLRAER